MNEVFYKKVMSIYEGLNSGNSVHSILERLMTSFQEFISCDLIAIALLDNSDNIYSYAIRNNNPQKIVAGYVQNHRYHAELRSIFRSKESEIFSNISKNEPISSLLEEKMQSGIYCPLITGNIGVGTIIFCSKKTDLYKDEHLDLIKVIANAVAIVIEKNFLVDDLILTSITGFAKLVEAKDVDSGHHLDRVQNYSRIIAQELAQNSKYENRITRQFVEDVYKFSPLHDIGKVGIADGILLKPAKLSPEEFEVMKKHTVIGAEVLKQSSRNLMRNGRNFFDIAIEIALAHHEKFDGNGYPMGLVGEEIPLAARVVIAADILDALTSKRVYKDPIDIYIAFNMMMEENGKTFDPEVIASMMNTKEKLIDIYFQFRETTEWNR